MKNLILMSKFIIVYFIFIKKTIFLSVYLPNRGERTGGNIPEKEGGVVQNSVGEWTNERNIEIQRGQNKRKTQGIRGPIYDQVIVYFNLLEQCELEKNISMKLTQWGSDLNYNHVSYFYHLAHIVNLLKNQTYYFFI